MSKRHFILIFYLTLLLLPIYWMLNMSLRTNADIMRSFELFPSSMTLSNYSKIFADPSWYSGYINTMIYVSINTVISLVTALPAAYAFSRFRFIGDKHVFFWLLTNRMAPPAVFLLPFFQLYSTFNLIDTHIAVAMAHCLFNVPLAVFIPLIRAGIGVTAFFCFMFSWVELLLARTLTTTVAKPIAATMTRTVSASGLDWGLLAAAGILTIVPGALVIWFVRNHLAKGFALGRV